MKVKYIDTHCHLQFEQYADDREKIIERMKEEGVAGIVVGVDLESSKTALALAEKYENLFASVGMHPHNVMDIVSPSSDDGLTMSKLRELAEHPKVVAIGECGLDYYRLSTNETAYSAEATKAKQKELLQKHIALAAELDKPLVIHARPSFAKATEGKSSNDAYFDLAEILKKAKIAYPKLRGNVHFFAGTLVEAKEFFALGFTISFTAVITFSRDYDSIISTVPLTNILSETDAPYVAPASRRGERNDPLAVVDVVRQIAVIRSADVEDIRTAIFANAKRLFAV